MSNGLKLEIDTESHIFSDFGYSLQLKCGAAPHYISQTGKGQLIIPFAGHTGPHETLRLSILSSIDGLYQTMATASAKLIPGTSKPRSAVVKFTSKTGAFDTFEISINYILVPRSRSDVLMDMKNNICLSVQATFHGGASPEDLVLRLLDQTENCLGMCAIAPLIGGADLVIDADLTSSDLQLSIAGENSGVSWIPMRWGAPMAWLVPLEPRGWISVTAHLMEGKGQTVIAFAEATYTQGQEAFSNVLFHMLPLPAQSRAIAASSTDVRYTDYPPSASDLQQIVEGVKSAPVLSRSEVSRGPAHGVYVIPSPPESRHTLLFSHDAIDGHFENSIRVCVVVLGVQPLELSSAAFHPAVSVIGHALLTIDPHTCSQGGLSRVLKGTVREGNGKEEDSSDGVIAVTAHLSVFSAHPPSSAAPLPLPDESDAITEHPTATSKEPNLQPSPDKPQAEEAQLESVDKLLFDNEATEAISDVEAKPPDNTPGVREYTPAQQPTESPQSILPVVEPPATLSPQLSGTSPEHTLHGPAGAGGMGSVGYPMNPRHVLSSSSVMTAGGAGSSGNNVSALADTLSAEIQAKQRTIDKLSTEMALKQEFYKRIEEENLSLKSENGRIKMRIAEAHTALARREQESDDAAKYVQELSANPEAFHHWDRELLVHLIKEAGVHIRRLDTETHALRETVASTEKVRSKYGNVCTQLSELQDAHLMQAKFLQKLKERAVKVTQCEDTIRAQEEVITRMQSVLETQLRSRPSGRAPGVTLSQSMLSKSLPSKKDGDSETVTQPVMQQPLFSEEDPKMKKEISDLKLANDRLKNEVDIRSRRIESLEHQLISSAHEASKEISKLRTKILDFELNHADTQPFGSNYESGPFDAMARSADDDSGVSSERMRQKLMVPFESMSNKSFDQYAQKPHNTRGDGTSGVESILDDVDEDDDFQRYKRSVGGSINLSSPSLRPKGLDRQYNNSGTNSRPSSSSNRLQSLVKPLGANSATDFIDSYY